MASKRGMYKPVQTNVGKNRNRRPLAQGRLVTAPAQPSTTVRRLQQGVVIEGDEQRSAVRAQVFGDDPTATPRRTVPRATQVHSPMSSPHIRTLDLSESDDDPDLIMETAARSRRRQVEVKPVPHVMVCDASMLSESPNIKCKVAYERSPATVICHSHSPLRLASAETERVEEIFQVSTSSGVTKVPIRSGTSPVSVISPLRFPTSPLLNRNQSSLGGSQVLEPMTRLAQPSFEDSGESEREEGRRPGDAEKEREGGGRQRNNPPPAEVTSESETCSLFEYVPQAKNRSKTAEGSSKAAAPKSARKKKGERVVASRYMQSAQSKRGVSNETTKKTNSSASLNVNSSSGAGVRSNISSVSNSSNSNFSQMKSRTPRDNPDDLFACSTRIQGSNLDGRGRQGKTSTPTHDNVPNMTIGDASAIKSELSMLSMGAGHRLGGGACGVSRGQPLPRKQTKGEAVQNMQDRLDCAHARYLQWHFLDSKAKMALRQQEEEAMQQLHGLWNLMENTQKEKGELERDVYRLKHLNILDNQLQSQHRILDPVLRVLPILKKTYRNMVNAVDITRHQLPTHGIVLPQDKDEYMETLEQLLLECEDLLGTLNTLTRKQAPSVTEVAEALNIMQASVKTQCKDLNRCAEQVSAIQSLATQEMSLRIQYMQMDN